MGLDESEKDNLGIEPVEQKKIESGKEQDESSKISIIIIIICIIILAVIGWFLISGGSKDNNAQTAKVEDLVLPEKEPIKEEPEEANDEPELSADQSSTGTDKAVDDTPELAVSTRGATKKAPSNSGADQSVVKMEEGDKLLRQELTSLSPGMTNLLQTPKVMDKLVKVINDFSQGQRPFDHTRFFKMDTPFIAETDKQGYYLSEASYRRYDSFAKSFAEIDAAAAVKSYLKMRPFLEKSYEQFGYPDSYKLEDIMKKAAAELIAAPVVDGRVGLVRPTVHYKFENEMLENLSPPQKQMLRMGPKNTRMIQKKLRELVQQLVLLERE